MASRTAWVAGLGQGLTWGAVLTQAAAGTLVNGNAILDNADIANGGSLLDIFADFSISLTIASSTIATGANLAFWIYMLNQDGTTYGDNHLTTSSATVTPSTPPDFVIPCFAAAAQTTIIGNARGIIIPPGTFRFGVQNNCGFTLTAATYKYRTYNTNLNS